MVLDVVYNHLGPEGNVLSAFGPYFTDRYRTPWGDAVNFDGPDSDEVRGYFVQNARQWFTRLPRRRPPARRRARIVDRTAAPFLAELSGAAAELRRSLVAGPCLIAESADNDPQGGHRRPRRRPRPGRPVERRLPPRRARRA